MEFFNSNVTERAKHSGTRGANLLRPEAVESLWYLWRVTHEQRWRDYGWAMFEAFRRHCRQPDGAYSGIHVRPCQARLLQTLPACGCCWDAQGPRVRPAGATAASIPLGSCVRRAGSSVVQCVAPAPPAAVLGACGQRTKPQVSSWARVAAAG